MFLFFFFSILTKRYKDPFILRRDHCADLNSFIVLRRDKLLLLYASTYLEFVFFPVDYHSGDLLVHEYKNSDQQSRKCSCQVHPPGVSSKRRNEPAPQWACWLK